jgi:hypothetical protein
MLRGNRRQLQSPKRGALPPIAFIDLACASLSQECADSKWGEPASCRITRRDAGHGSCIEMIVVIMGEDYSVDGRQTIEVNAGWYPPFRPDETEWGRSLAPNRIHQHIEPCDLDQKTGVTDPGHRQLIRCCPRYHEGGGKTLERRRIGIGAARISPMIDQRPF